MNHPKISDRAQLLLRHLVELYLREGQPVGSKTLASKGFAELSPATVRKVLGDLEDQGYLTSPHTSAGRVPTAQGIRFFVDSLFSVHQLDVDPLAAQRVHDQLDAQPAERLIMNASTILSELTHMVGVITLPYQEYHVLRHIEFLPLSDHRVLAILVFNE
jgi:heat-inducible transcriptional repressor